MRSLVRLSAHNLFKPILGDNIEVVMLGVSDVCRCTTTIACVLGLRPPASDGAPPDAFASPPYHPLSAYQTPLCPAFQSLVDGSFTVTPAPRSVNVRPSTTCPTRCTSHPPTDPTLLLQATRYFAVGCLHLLPSFHSIPFCRFAWSQS